MPELTPAELAAFRRPGVTGRPPIGTQPRKAIALRIDPIILGELRDEATRRGLGYQTLINDVLVSAVLHFRDREAR
jgi:uncharacterized protein (DUF4415 family)